MSTLVDGQIGYKKESAWGTEVTVDAFVEPVEEDLAWTPEWGQGAGLRTAMVVDRADRTAILKSEVGGSFTTELITKGHGKLFEAALGGGASNNIAGASYQQLFTPASSLPSYTIQTGVPESDNGSVQPHTFFGMVCSGFEFTASNVAYPQIKWNWVGKDYVTATSLASASFPSSTDIFSWADVSVTIGGTVVVPSTTVLSSGGTATADVRDISITYENTLDTNGFNAGGGGKRSRKPSLGKRMITGSITAEFDSTTLRDLFTGNTSTAVTVKLQKSTAISGSNYPTIEFTIPVVKFRGGWPNLNLNDTTVLTLDFEVKDGGVAAYPFYVAIVTAETAI